jgi:hypothetical protein
MPLFHIRVHRMNSKPIEIIPDDMLELIALDTPMNRRKSAFHVDRSG